MRPSAQDWLVDAQCHTKICVDLDQQSTNMQHRRAGNGVWVH